MDTGKRAFNDVFYEIILTLIIPIVTVLGLIVIIRISGNIEYESVTVTKICNYFIASLSDHNVLNSVYCTLYVSAKGLLAGIVISLLFFFILGLKPSLAKHFIISLNGIRAIPLTLLIPFLGILPVILAFPPGIREHLPSKDPAYLIATGAFLYIIIGAVDGIENRLLDRQMFFKNIVGLSNSEYFFKILFFESLPSFFTALRLATLFALVIAIVLEQLIYYPGIGRMIMDKITQATTDSDLAAQAVSLLLLVAFLGVLIDSVHRIIKSLISKWL